MFGCVSMLILRRGSSSEPSIRRCGLQFAATVDSRNCSPTYFSGSRFKWPNRIRTEWSGEMALDSNRASRATSARVIFYLLR